MILYVKSFIYTKLKSAVVYKFTDLLIIGLQAVVGIYIISEQFLLELFDILKCNLF